jgi:uncharacterized membrane protein YdbT with pleckstrin-like domain
MAKENKEEKPEPAEEKIKYFPDQLDDEEVLMVFRKHPVVMRKGLVLCMLGPLLGVIPAAVKPELGFTWFFGGLIAGIVLGILFFFPSWINWYYSVFIVTDQRLIQITQKGLFNRSFVDLSLNQIQSLNYEVAGIQATLLGYGTILVQTYMGDLVIHDVHHPAKIYKRLVSILKDEGVTPVPMAQEQEEAREDREEIEAEEA